MFRIYVSNNKRPKLILTIDVKRKSSFKEGLKERTDEILRPLSDTGLWTQSGMNVCLCLVQNVKDTS